MTESLARLTVALADRYRIERELGQGGMATVYLAEDLKHGRRVALKVLHPELAAVLGGERFLAEIKTTAHLQHPNILQLFDSGSADGLLYYVMPFVDGESLRNRLAREKQLPVEEAITIARGAAAALDYAHRHGVIHRDIKPENILLQDGQPLVADFGIALAVKQAGGARLTQTGLSLGTPQYMSPEQATGERELDVRSDVYALGAVTYEMLGGEPPFTGSTTQAIIAKLMTEEPRPLGKFRKSVPLHVQAAVHRALEKLPADRFASAAAFSDALARSTLEQTAASLPAQPMAGEAALALEKPGTKPWRSRLIAALWLVPGVLLGALAWQLLRRPHTPAPLRLSVALPANQAIRTDHEGTSLALSPDGRRVVYVGRGEGGRTQLYERALDQLEARPLPGTESGESPFYSPDGQWIAFFKGSKLVKAAVAGGPPLPLANCSTERGGTWGPDDFIVFSASSSGPLLRVRASGGSVDTLSKLGPDELSHRWPTFLPGGKAVIFVIQSSNGYSVGALSLKERKVVKLIENGLSPRYAPNGQLLYGTEEGALVAIPFDPGKLRVKGSPVSLLGGLVTHVDGSAEFDISGDGALAYVGGGSAGRTLVLVDREGKERAIGSELASLDVPRFSPDGKRVAFQASDQGVRSLRLLDLERGTLSRFTSEGQAQYPAWTPDGRRIAFAWSKRGTQSYDLYWVAADGSGAPEPLLQAPQAQWEISFAPDGRRVVYRETHPRTSRDLWLMAVDSPGTARPYLRTQFNERSPSISPDGHWLAYVSDESGLDEVYVRSFPDPAGVFQISAGGGREPLWARSGHTLYYRTSDSLMAVPVQSQPSFSLGESRALFANTYANQPQHADFDVGPDEKHFVFVRQSLEAPNLVVALHWLSQLGRSPRTPR